MGDLGVEILVDLGEIIYFGRKGTDCIQELFSVEVRLGNLIRWWGRVRSLACVKNLDDEFNESS